MTDPAHAAPDRPLVTFAVIAYNQERFIREAVEGAFAQTYSPLEIILSDDCSPDRTFAIMQEMAAAYDGPHRVSLNRNPVNLGIVPHIDRVMELEKGDFIVVNAGDDVSAPERAEKLAAVWLASGRRAKLVHSAARQIDAESRPLAIRRPPQRTIDSPTPRTIICEQSHVIGATAAWDRAVYDVFGPLGEGLSTEDRVIPFRAALLGKIVYLDDNLIKHRITGISSHVGEYTGHDYLYGIAHKLRKWHTEIDRHILERFADRSYPDKAEIEAVCKDRLPASQFTVDLAGASHAQRLTMAPRAIRLSVGRRSAGPLKDWLRYLFDRLYIPYATWRMGRQASSQPTAPSPEPPESRQLL